MTAWPSTAMVDHLWQSTLFVALVWLATLALRQNRARVRCWLWVAASVKFLIPVSALVGLGARFEWRAAPAIAQPAAAFVMDDVLALPMLASVVAAPGARETSIVPWVLGGFWVAGFLVVLLRWWREWMPIRAARRAATPLSLDAACDTTGLRVLASPASFEPGVVGIWRPVLLIPEGLVERLTPRQLQALIAHERCHVRCHDNLFAAVHMLVEATFWFHPLVWWIERRLIDERERACDEAVLSAGSRPADYAQGILTVCRWSVGSPLPCVAGVTGSDLRRRIEVILRGGLGRPIGGGTRLALLLTGAACVGIPIVVGTVHAVPVITIAQGASVPVAFEVASVRANKSGDRSALIQEPAGGFTATNVPLRLLITWAYQISDNQLLDAPDWIRAERFDIVARLDHDPPAVPRSEPGNRRLALRALLTERFRLAVKRETREFAMYALVMARADGRPGPMLTPSSTDCSPEAVKARISAAQPVAAAGMCGSRFNTGRIRFGGYPISEFAKVFSPYNGRTVIDRTGLTGNWDFDLTFTADRPEPPPPGQEPPVIDPNGPSLLTAMQDQLGLKLESTKGRVDVLAVERVERPSEN
jgi:bla regulator protein BlaR1